MPVPKVQILIYQADHERMADIRERLKAEQQRTVFTADVIRYLLEIEAENVAHAAGQKRKDDGDETP